MRVFKKVALSMLAMAVSAAIAPAAIAEDGIPLNATYFPDEHFRELVREFDSDENGVLEVWEINEIKTLSKKDSDISNLQGIQYFPNLQTVDLRSSKGKITNVDVSSNPHLQYLLLDGNPVTRLNVQSNQQLQSLWLDGSSLERIDVTGNPRLSSLHLEANRLSTIDVSRNPELWDLSIRNLDNQGKISKLDLRNNQKLTGLAAEGNHLTELDVSGNPELEELMIGNNQISHIDVSHNRKLTGLTVDNNRLEHIDLRNNPELMILGVGGNQLTEIDLSANKNLRSVYLDNNRLTAVDFQGMKYLSRVHASNNELLALTNMNLLECTGYSVFCTPGDGFKAEGQRYVSNSRKLDLVKTVPNIQLDRIRNIRGGELDGGVLQPHLSASEVSYQYLTDDGNHVVVQVVFPAAGESVVFRDVSASTPHREDIAWLADNKISQGWKVGDSYEFRGMNAVVRQDMAAFLRREAVRRNIGDAATWKPSASDWKAFRDVDARTPHAEDILWLAHAGISTGWAVRGGREFRGMDTVKRQDMAAFLKRLADKAGKGRNVAAKRNFRDVVFTGPQSRRTSHSDEIAWLAGSGVSEGWKVGSTYEFRGMSSVVRQDMAAFLHRLDEKILTK